MPKTNTTLNRTEIAIAVSATQNFATRLGRGDRITSIRVLDVDSIGDLGAKLNVLIGATSFGSVPNVRIKGSEAASLQLQHVDALGIGVATDVHSPWTCGQGYVPGLMMVLDGEYANEKPIGWCLASDVIDA